MVSETHVRLVRMGGLALLGLAPLLGGCQAAIHGDWHMVEVAPNRQVFCIDNATFRPDGTYSATTTLEGVTADEKGTYEFTGFKLMLRPAGGGQRTYTAQATPSRITLTSDKRKVVLEKGKKGR
jgi:hypothetical protein